VTPWVRHKLTMAMRLSESPVAGDELRSEARGGRDVHPVGQSWDGVCGRRNLPIACLAWPLPAKPESAEVVDY
jgi:hypothetical protein